MKNRQLKRIKALAKTKSDLEIIQYTKKRFSDDKKRVDYILYYFKEKFLQERNKQPKKYIVTYNHY